MKYKIHILFLIVTLLFGMNVVGAADCYYISDGFSAQYEIASHRVYINKFANEIKDEKAAIKTDLKNFDKVKKENGYEIPAYTNANACPTYLILHFDRRFIRGHYVYGTNDINVATNAIASIGTKKKHFGFYATIQPGMDEKKYYDEFAKNIFKPSSQGYGGDISGLTCDELFGDRDYAGETDVDLNGNGKIDPPSLAYLINTVLNYVRIIVPILIILFGSFDFATAVVAAKEDEMKKARVNFVKRLIAGVAVFFAPVIVNILMWLADIVWEGLGYASCNW